MRRETRTDTSPGASPAPSLLLWLTLVVGFILYFILPRLEAYWLALGVRLPAWELGLITASHFLHTYWYALLIGLFLWLWLGLRDSGRRAKIST
jgi:type II secretory pathway component PulF